MQLHDIITQNIPMGVILTQDGKIKYLNEWAQNYTGYTLSEIEGRSFLDFVHPADHEKLIQRYSDVMSGKENLQDTRYQVINRDKQTFWIKFRSILISYHGRDALLSFLIDETREQVREDTLRKSEERYRKLVDHLAEGIVVVQEGKICFINETLRKKLGLKPGSVLNKSFLDFIHPADQAGIVEKYLKRISGEKVPEVYEARLVKPDGEILICQMRASLIAWEGAPATQTAILDLTDRKKAHIEKEELRKQLIRMEKMESLGLLAGGVAHDLNNVLSGIVSYPDLLMLDLPEEHKFRFPLEEIKSSGLKAAAIVSDLLTLARRGVMTDNIVNLNDIVQDYLSSPECRRQRSFYPDVSVKTYLNSDLKNIRGSELHLRKTIMNLFSNATEAQSSGGQIDIHTSDVTLNEPLQGYELIQKGEYALFTIQDRGVGIDSEDLQKIFEPFYTKKVMGRSGTGLGMAVVWGTVKDHGGYIDIKSIKNLGTKFDLYFPVTHEKPGVKKDKQPQTEYMGNREKILVVDDVKEQLKIASAVLTRLNYTAETASSGEQAVELIGAGSYDLVVLDMIMDPGIDGLETYKRIQRIQPCQKVIIASGFSENRSVKQAIELGVLRFIKKPYSVETIGRAVHEALHTQVK